MRLSHSKLSTILYDPKSYYLGYVMGISQIAEKPAFLIGSAVHWGIENNTCDLSEYYDKTNAFNQQNTLTRERMLCESMVYGYLKHKDSIYEKILTCPKTGEKLELLEETHEIFLECDIESNLIDSFRPKKPHKFVGIVDLLLLTNKGFIVIDYKTSTFEPDWNDYLEQIYRYIMLVQKTFPDIPIVKIGIINIRKTGIRQKKTENESEFLNRMRFEYELNDEKYVNYHEYAMDTIDKNIMYAYIDNLTTMCDMAQIIDDLKLYFTNYGAQKNQYGRSEYYDIIYETPGAHVLYQIKDRIYNPDTEEFESVRPCVEIDMKVVNNRCMNKYSEFLKYVNSHVDGNDKVYGHEIAEIIESMKVEYLTDDALLQKYRDTLIMDLSTYTSLDELVKIHNKV